MLIYKIEIKKTQFYILDIDLSTYNLILYYLYLIYKPQVKNCMLDKKCSDEMEKRQRSHPVPVTPLRPRQTRTLSALSEGLDIC